MTSDSPIISAELTPATAPPGVSGSPSPAKLTPAAKKWRPPAIVSTIFANAPLLLLFLLPVAAEFLENPDKVDPTNARLIMMIGLNITLGVSLQLINGISGQFSLGHAGFMAVGAYMGGYATSVFAPNFERPPSPLLFFVSAVVLVVIISAISVIVYRALRSLRYVWHGLPSIAFIALILWVMLDVGVYFYGFSGWIGFRPQQLFGWLGQLFNEMTTGGEKPLTLLMALIGGGLCAAAVGLLVGLPTLRLKGDYLAIATLGFAIIIETIITVSKPLGGATGLFPPVYANAADPEEHLAAHYIFPWIWGAALVTVMVVWRLSHSAKGRAIKAVREDEIAAAAVGLDTTHFKVVAFVTGAFFAGVAGALYAHYDGYLNPKQFQLQRSIELVVIVTVAGLGRIWGAVIAAVVLTFLPFFLRQPQHWLEFALQWAWPPFGQSKGTLAIPAWLDQNVLKFAEQNQTFVYSVLLVAVMLLRGRNFLGRGLALVRPRRAASAAPARGAA